MVWESRGPVVGAVDRLQKEGAAENPPVPTAAHVISVVAL